MPGPGTDRRRAIGTGGQSRGDKARDAKPVNVFPEDTAIQDRIRRWQVQNDEEAVDLDALSVRSRPWSEAFRTPNLSRASSPIMKEPQTTPRKRSTKWVQQDNKQWTKQRRSLRDSQGRSDLGRIDQADMQSEIQSVHIQNDLPPATYVRDDSTHTRNVTSSRAEREDRRRRRREARVRASGTTYTHDNYTLQPDDPPGYGSEQHHDNGDQDQETHIAQPSDPEPLNDRYWVVADESPSLTQEDFERKSFEYTESNIEDMHTYQPSKYAQTLGQGITVPDPIQLPKGRKLTLLNKTMSILGGRGDAPPPSNRIPSIEAWLEEQPGPSFERDDQSTQSDNNPKPLKKHSRRKKISIDTTIVEVEDPNKIWDSITKSNQQGSGLDKDSKVHQLNISTINTETSPSKRRLFSFEIPNGLNKGGEPTPPLPEQVENEVQSSRNLQRRGAKSRRVKSDSISGGIEAPTEEQLPSHSKLREVPDRIIQQEESTEHTHASKSIELNNDKADAQTKFANTQATTLKRKLTHEDLISLLSQPRLRKSTKSVRSVKRAPNLAQKSALPSLLEAMRNEEPKYNQELRTLVDGVTPVLLQSILSKTTTEATLGLFSNDENQEANFTKPIIQMGIALERLKALHNRIPLGEHEIDGFLSWASSAERHYQDYIKWYRLGFQGILVNLAPLGTPRTAEEEFMARDLDGDVTDADGQKVDVAYLQKRPLVRLKKISKLISAVRDQHPTSEKALKLADAYVELTEKAKQRYNEEQGRLEDEVAANIDVTRTRDIRTMAPITSVQIDKRRKVRARDCFEMTLYHSTGQRMDCRIEIIIRDDPLPDGSDGDILICQVEETSKWLLFAPVNINNVSARRDESTLDIILMVRGTTGIAETWHELLALKADVSDAVVEWVQMLGSSPLPPKLCQTPTVIQSQMAEQPLKEEVEATVSPKAPQVPLSAAALASLPSDLDVPIGEPSLLGFPTNKEKKPTPASAKSKVTVSAGPKLNLGGGLQKTEIPDLSLRMKIATDTEKRIPSPIGTRPLPRLTTSEGLSSKSKGQPGQFDTLLPKNNIEKNAGPLLPSPVPGKPHQPLNITSHPQAPMVSHSAISGKTPQLPSLVHSDTSSKHRETVWSKTGPAPGTLDSRVLSHVSDKSTPNQKSAGTELNQTTCAHGKAKPTHTQEQAPPQSKASTSLTESIREQWAAVSGYKTKRKSVSFQTDTPEFITNLVTDNYPTPGNRKPDNHPRRQEISLKQEPAPPPPPPHRESLRPAVDRRAPVSASIVSSNYEIKINRHLTTGTHQGYQSSSSGSVTYSDDDDTSDTSEEDYCSEIKDQATPLVTVAQGGRRFSQIPHKPLPSLPSVGSRTLQPSDSASNAPYRRAPSPSAYPVEKKRRTAAMVCSWSDRGVWQPIHDQECSIVISPGLVQAFKMTAAHSQPMAGATWEDNPAISTDSELPLVEFELTPIVPLRKGTALDITIRSPPTPRSTVQTTNNVMFRSKTTQDCEKLYQLINWARCNNPTYAQLARSRPRDESLTFNPNAAATKTRSWFSFGSYQKSSYRASSQPPPSMADTGASGTSTFSAFSALKRFGKNSPFSLKRSSVVRKSGISVMGESLYSSSNGTGSGSGTSTPAPSQAGFVPGPDGPNVPATSAEAVSGGGMVNNMKIHLFLRQGQKWEQLGQCHLTVLPAVTSSEPIERPVTTAAPQAPQSTTTTGPSAMSNARARHYRLPSSSHTPHKIHGDGREKRILITSVKNKEIVLLDETLSETCFEKIMQTGIAINVWKEDEAVQDRGGVLTGRSRTYMVQFKTSMEASWVFNMCGVYRYGAAAGN